MSCSVASAKILIVGLTFAVTIHCCNCSRPPQDYLAIEVGSSRGARAIDWLVGRLEQKLDSEAPGSSKIHSSLSAASLEALAELPSAGVGVSADWSGETVAIFLKRAMSIAKRAALLPRNKLPPASLDETGVLKYEGDFFILEYTLRKLLNLIGEPITSETDSRICFSDSDTNEQLQLIITAFGSISNFEYLIRSAAKYSHSKLLNYLKLYGTAHYAECLARVGNKFREAERNLDGEKLARFDKLVSSTKFTSFKKPLDERLASMARDLDFQKSKLVIQRLSNAVGTNPEVPGLVPATETSYETVTNFLSIVCNNIRSAHLDTVFTVYNLARLFVPKEARELELKMPDRFMKLNEYQRLCKQYRSSQNRRDISVNLIDNDDKGLFRRMFGYEMVAAKAGRRNKQN